MRIANVQAGTGSNNVIPGELFVQFNFRFSTELTDEMIKARVHALLEKHQLRYTVDWWALWPAVPDRSRETGGCSREWPSSTIMKLNRSY